MCMCTSWAAGGLRGPLDKIRVGIRGEKMNPALPKTLSVITRKGVDIRKEGRDEAKNRTQKISAH